MAGRSMDESSTKQSVTKSGSYKQSNEMTLMRTSDERDDTSTSSGSEGFLFTYGLSFFAASCAELVTYPLDLIKARLQIQGEAALDQFNAGKVRHLQKRGMAGMGIGIVREEGLFRLWHGMSPAIYRHLVYSGVRITLYEFIRDDIIGKHEDGTIPLSTAVFGGVIAGGVAQFLASPADLVKIHVQMEGRRKQQGLPPRVTGAWDAARKITVKSGMRGLWNGWIPNVQRAALVNLGDLTTYDTAKHLVLNNTSLKDDYLLHAAASACSGLIAAVLGTPADVIKTRVMNQPLDESGRGLFYKGSMDCLIQSVRKEGFWSLYKGFVPCWIRMGPWSLTFWLTYEELRKLSGRSSF